MGSQKGFAPIFIIFGIIIILGLVGGAYYIGSSKNNTSNNSTSNSSYSNTNTNQASPIASTTVTKNERPAILQFVDLGLIKKDLLQTQNQAVNYYQVGIIPDGQYKGYKRIVAVLGPWGPGGSFVKIFATQDDQHYILDGNQGDAKLHPDNDLYFGINKDLISGLADLSQSPPQTIQLDSKSALFKGAPYTESRETGKQDEHGNPITTDTLVTDFSSYPSLPSSNPNYKFYYKKLEADKLLGNLNDSQMKGATTKLQYLDGNTEVIVVDSQGLAYSYTMTTPSSITTYTNVKNNKSYDFVLFPNLKFSKTDIVTSNGVYDAYDNAFPSTCGGDQYTYVVKNISDNDLRKIGTQNGMDLYTLKDKSHPLNRLEYDYKINSFPSDNEFKLVNPNTTKPALDEYFSKNPVLLMKDYWGRWIAFGEYDYKLLGGCGKPVVYLYPTKPTQVSVEFASAMQLDIDIPTYHNSWKVLAQPNGLLTDLQPEYTNCDAIDATQFGSEYAKQACQQNIYPYLYWSGRSLNNPYPTENKGWIISRDNLVSFMDTTLSDINFNNKEKTDMLSYWLPKMLVKGAPYYKISFLQTAQMNQLVPMLISPKPDTIFRLFLDWTPLESEPSIYIAPQHLEKLQRNGFTIVEWGGLKQ